MDVPETARTGHEQYLVAVDAAQAHADVAAALDDGGYAGVPADAAGLADDDGLLDRLEAVVLVIPRSELRRGGRVRRLRTQGVELPLVVVAEGVTHQTVRDAISCGADAYVPLEDVAGDLAFAVDAARAGYLCVPRTVRRTIAPAVLSHREREVLARACRGLTNQEIADELYLSLHTVKSHLASSFRKLGVNSRAEARSMVARQRVGAARALGGAATGGGA